MIQLKFFIVDVFAEKKYEGNQLAVFLDLENRLDDATMQSIAKEINFAETTFIKSNDSNQRFRVKIYTVEHEMPFAGHPSIGTSYIISKFILPQPQKKITLELAHGDIEIAISSPEKLDQSVLFMTQTQPEFLDVLTHNEIANRLDIPADLMDTSLPVQEISTGLPYIIVPIKDLRAMGKLTLPLASLQKFVEDRKESNANNKLGHPTALYFFTKGGYGNEDSYNARMFLLENGKVAEDAATGSACGCLLAYLLKYVDQNITATVEQGFQMGRKSYLYLTGSIIESRFQIKVGGRTKLISEGTWFA